MQDFGQSIRKVGYRVGMLCVTALFVQLVASSSANALPFGSAASPFVQVDDGIPSPTKNESETNPPSEPAGNSSATPEEGESEEGAPQVNSPATGDNGLETTDPSTDVEEEPKDEIADPKLKPEVIERNEILAKIDERYAPRQPQAVTVELPEKSPNLVMAIVYSMGVGLLLLVTVMVLVLKPR
jgi:hypothetical protein